MGRPVDAARAVAVAETDQDGILLIKNPALEFDPDADTWIYMGVGEAGADPSKPVWKIAQATRNGSGVVTRVKWADGDAEADNVWDNRAALTYV